MSCVAYAPDDSACFATCSLDGSVRVWDVTNYTVTARGVCQTSLTG